MTSRLDALRAKLQTENLDGLLVSHPSNRRYLSGFTGSSGTLLITPTETLIVAPPLYYEQIGREVSGFTLWQQPRHPHEAIGALLQEKGIKRVGFEAETLSVAEYDRWRAAAPEVEWRATEGLVAELRAVKDEEELNGIRQAQAISDQAFAQLLTIVQPGKTERDIAWAFEQIIHDLGAEGVAFPTIVASGVNSALPHYRAAERVIGENEIVLIDFGVRFKGYNSDCTRTLFTGDPNRDPKFVRVYNIVAEAVSAAEAGIKAGLPCLDADKLARDVIAGQGHGAEFGHGLGHGIGLDVHEAPSMGQRVTAEKCLPAGSVVTIEPGIYFGDWGGVRIEDLAIVREDGVEVLTQATKAIDAWQQANRR
jgi:Xaa-Pro aminopeptidase